MRSRITPDFETITIMANGPDAIPITSLRARLERAGELPALITMSAGTHPFERSPTIVLQRTEGASDDSMVEFVRALNESLANASEWLKATQV
jgi:hypothetical protein